MRARINARPAGYGLIGQLARKRDERGAVLVLAAAAFVVAMISAALAVDIGFLAADKRTDQKIADLAALDASRDLAGVAANCSPPPLASGPLCPAVISANRNFSAADAPTTISAELVSPDGSGGWVPDANGSSVRVTVSSPRDPFFPFVGNDVRTVAASAVAGPGNAIGTVRVGSTVASAAGSITPAQDLLLDKTLSALIGGTYQTNAVGWEGLASGGVTFGALTESLAAVTGNGTFNVGTTNEVLNATFTAAQLFAATANALNNSGQAADVSVANSVQNIGLAASGTSLSAPLKLYDLFNFGSVVVGNKEDVANVTLNVLELIKAGAILADGDHLASFNLTSSQVLAATGLAMPGTFDNVTVSMGLIEAPQQSFPGPAGQDDAGNYYTSAHTSQIRVRLDVKLKIPLLQPIKVAGLTVLATGSLLDTNVSYYLDGGAAHAYLEALDCGTSTIPSGVDILGVTDVARSRLGFVNDANLQSQATVPIPVAQPTPVVSILGLLNVRMNGVVTTTVPGNNGTLLTFTPPYANDSPSQPVSGTTLELPAVANANLTIDPLVALLDTGTLVSTLVSGINSSGITFNSTLPGLTTTILKPLYDAIGLSFGGADIWAPPVQSCSALSPVGSTVSTGNPPILKG